MKPSPLLQISPNLHTIHIHDLYCYTHTTHTHTHTHHTHTSHTHPHPHTLDTGDTGDVEGLINDTVSEKEGSSSDSDSGSSSSDAEEPEEGDRSKRKRRTYYMYIIPHCLHLSSPLSPLSPFLPRYPPLSLPYYCEQYVTYCGLYGMVSVTLAARDDDRLDVDDYDLIAENTGIQLKRVSVCVIPTPYNKREKVLNVA